MFCSTMSGIIAKSVAKIYRYSVFSNSFLSYLSPLFILNVISLSFVYVLYYT